MSAMTKKEYQSQIKTINTEANEKKKEVMREYAMSNNPYNIGDIVKDHQQTIKVDDIKIQISSETSMPQCVYYGILLKKDGTPYKSGKKEYVYQSNIKN